MDMNIAKLDQFEIHRKASELRAQEMRNGVKALATWFKSLNLSTLTAAPKHG